MSNKSSNESSVMIHNDRIPKGIELCIANTFRLLDDAKLLFDKERYSTAILLAILAYEELGKALMLRQKWLDGEDIGESFWNNEITSHVKKAERVNMYVSDNTPGINNTNFQKLRSQMATYRAELMSRDDRFAYTFVDWRKNRWASPNKPRMALSDTDNLQQLRSMAELYIVNAETALSHFIRSQDTKAALEEPNREPMTSQQAMDFIRNELGRPKGKIGIEVKSNQQGQIFHITLTWADPVLTKKEQKKIRAKIEKILPKLKNLEIAKKASV